MRDFVKSSSKCQIAVEGVILSTDEAAYVVEVSRIQFSGQWASRLETIVELDFLRF